MRFANFWGAAPLRSVSSLGKLARIGASTNGDRSRAADVKPNGAADLYGELKSLCIALVVQFSNEDQPSAEYEETLFALNQIIARLNAASG